MTESSGTEERANVPWIKIFCKGLYMRASAVTLEIKINCHFAVDGSEDMFSCTRVPSSVHYGKHMHCFNAPAFRG